MHKARDTKLVMPPGTALENDKTSKQLGLRQLLYLTSSDSKDKPYLAMPFNMLGKQKYVWKKMKRKKSALSIYWAFSNLTSVIKLH